MMLRKKLFFILIALPIASHAIWVSDIDQQYSKRDPETYALVFKDRQLIDPGPEKSNDAKAIADMKYIIAKHPNFAPAYVQLARATIDSGYLSSDDYEPSSLDEGMVYLKKALEIEPKYDYAIVMTGFILIMQGKYDDAAPYYHQADDLHSKYPYIMAQLGSLERHKGNYAKALSYLMKGYEQSKSNKEVAEGYIRGIIGTYQTMFYGGFPEDHNAEIEKWQKLRLGLEPDSAWNWGDYAQFKLYNLGDYETAIKYSQKALSIMDYGVGEYTLASAYYAKWAMLYGKTPNSPEAQTLWNKAAQVSPLTDEMILQLVFYGHGHFNDIKTILESKVVRANDLDSSSIP